MIEIKSSEIISVGTELLLGNIVNTDAAYISQRLAALGIPLFHQSTVGDNSARLEAELNAALLRSDLIILTGGLGPTFDDLTKETAARLMNRSMYMHEESLERMKARLNRYGFTMTENNKKQAMMPEGAVVFKNNYGTAPGLAIEDEDNGKILIMLPGPPRELEPMFREEVEPYLRKFSDKVFYSDSVHIFGMGESKVETVLKPLMTESQNPTLAPYAKTGEVLLRITASGKDEEECKALCGGMLDKIMQTEVAPYVYAVNGGSLEETLVRLLQREKKKISFAESCTGGLCVKRITDVSGASEVIEGSIVTYANRIKEEFVSVSEKTIESETEVSSQAALEMARGVRKLFSSDIGVSTTGYAGPTGGSEEKPVGTVFVGISAQDCENVLELHIGNGLAKRDYVRYVAASNAIYSAIKYLKENN